MYCYKCGKELVENTQTCPYCGAKQPTYQQEKQSSEQANKSFNVISIIGFALALSSIILHLSFLTSIAGLIVSIVGVMDCNKKQERGKVFAILGIVISAITLIFLLFVFSQVFGIYHDIFHPFMDEIVHGEIY